MGSSLIEGGLNALIGTTTLKSMKFGVKTNYKTQKSQDSARSQDI